jgi:cbb3-type cytochrome oxidase subunit 1
MKRERSVGRALVQIASIYMMAGVVLGIVMGVSESFALVSVHSHLGLLGWSTMAITGLVYIALPRCEGSQLSRWHFWFHNIGLPVMLVSLIWKEYGGSSQAEAGAGLGSFIVLVALLFFTINVFRNSTPAPDIPH